MLFKTLMDKVGTFREYVRTTMYLLYMGFFRAFCWESLGNKLLGCLEKKHNVSSMNKHTLGHHAFSRFLFKPLLFIILTIFHIPMSGLGVVIWFVFAQIQVPWRIHGTGALGPYMSGCFFNGKLVGKYSSPMDPIREKNKDFFTHVSKWRWPISVEGRPKQRILNLKYLEAKTDSCHVPAIQDWILNSQEMLVHSLHPPVKPFVLALFANDGEHSKRNRPRYK